MKRIVAALILLTLATPAWDGWDEGRVAYNRGDYAAALRELRPLAEQGDASARYNLDVMYEKGLGVPQDYVQAHKWYNLASMQGYKVSAEMRDIVATKMTPAQISKAQKLAADWYAAYQKRKRK